MHAPIRVLYLQPAAHFGGAERQAATIVPLLRELGVDAVPVVGPGHEIVEWLRERGVSDYVHSEGFPGGWPKPRGLAKLALPWRYARCMHRFRAELANLIVTREIDVVFAAMAYSWITATPVARQMGVPIVWRAGGTEGSGAQRRLLATWARWNRPDWLVCNGDAVQRFYAPLVGAPSCVIRNGLDVRQFYPCRDQAAALRPPGARCVIGFAGRLVPQKRPEDFIAAAARCAARDDVAFLLAGDGSRRAHYAELARRVGARTLQVTGYQHDMRAFYAACDVLVLPSRSEGCPNVVLEAMATGTAVVAAESPATREIVTDGVDGILYEVGAVDALAHILANLVDDPGRRRMLAMRGLQRVRQLGAWDCAARTAALLREIARDRSRRQLPVTARRRELRA